MKNKKILLGISIIAIGIIGSLYIVGSAEEDINIKKFISDDFLQTIQQDLRERDLSVEQLSELPVSEGNLTDLLAHTYAKYLVDNFPEELEDIERNESVELPIVTTEDIIDETFENRAIEMLSDFSSDRFKTEDIIISSNDNNQEHKRYFQEVTNSFNNTINESNINTENIIINWMRTDNPTDILRYSRTIKDFVENMRTIEVPPTWVKFHLGTINIWNKKRAILGSLPNTDEDPLKTVIALNLLPSIIDDISNLNDSLMEIIRSIEEDEQ